jgi:hypothetical protein
MPKVYRGSTIYDIFNLEKINFFNIFGFPMQYWNPVRFATIGNKLGNFIEVDMSFEETGLMSVARVLVRLDLRPGLLGVGN